MNTNLIQKAYSSEFFREEAHKLVDRMAGIMDQSMISDHTKTISWISPEDQLNFWREDFQQTSEDDLEHFWENVFSHSINNHSRGYMGHQVAVTPALTALTGSAIAFLNNSTTVYEIGMTANAMEKAVLERLANNFCYEKGAAGIVTSGGSLGNLTALLTARASSGISEENYSKLAIIVSKEAHYSVERAAEIMGISSSNILKIASDSDHRIQTDLLEQTYQHAMQDGKIVFCVIGCAGTTAVGAYDDLNAIADFAETHNIWFHVDGAHGAAVIFSDKYRHLINGIERSDSLVMDFHKMLMAPAISTAVLYNCKKHQINECSPSASYLWQNQQSEEWYNSAKHTLECTKPITILHTYAILKRYGDELYSQHVTYLYDLGKTFADMVSSRDTFELAVTPESNIVCFRYLPEHFHMSEDAIRILNSSIYQKLLEDGEFYIVNTTINGKFYLRVSLMNPLTQTDDIKKLLDKIEQFAKSV